jgi:hypothetical protein
LLGVGAHAGVSNNANRNAGGETAQAARKASSEVSKAGEGRVLCLAIRGGGGDCARKRNIFRGWRAGKVGVCAGRAEVAARRKV